MTYTTLIQGQPASTQTGVTLTQFDRADLIETKTGANSVGLYTIAGFPAQDLVIEHKFSGLTKDVICRDKNVTAKALVTTLLRNRVIHTDPLGIQSHVPMEVRLTLAVPQYAYAGLDYAVVSKLMTAALGLYAPTNTAGVLDVVVLQKLLTGSPLNCG